MESEGLDVTFYWVDTQGSIKRATSIIPNPLPEHLEDLTPVDGNEHGSPESGQQKWDGLKWLPLDPMDIPPTQTEIVDALLETAEPLPGPAGDKLRDIKQRHGR